MGDLAPRFTQKPSLKQEGKAIVFACELEASPKPSIQWYQGDQEITDTNKFNASLTEVSGSTNKYAIKLVVNNVSPDDSGSYKCEAKNKLGQMSANVNLNLQGLYS